MITDSLSSSLSGTDGARLSGSWQEAGTTRLNVDTTIPASTTDQLVSIAWTVANTQDLVVLATQDCTLKTNSASAPVNTINLKAGIPLVWGASPGYYANLFTADVTAWYVTTTAATRLQASILTS